MVSALNKIHWLVCHKNKPMLLRNIHIQSGNIIKHNLRTSMNERTHFFIKIYISHTLFSKGLMLLWCARWAERHILREGISSKSQGVPTLAPPSKLVRDASGRLRVPRSTAVLSTLSNNLSAWFLSLSYCLLPVIHVFDLSALIEHSCLLIKMWQMAKHTGSLGTKRKSMAYVILHQPKFYENYRYFLAVSRLSEKIYNKMNIKIREIYIDQSED